jgi:hypothetical protein
MRSMTKFWTTLACLSVLGCAEGSPSQPPVIVEPVMEVEPPSCGNNTVDVMKGEQCDCGPDVSTQCQVQGMDCTAVGRGAGVLLCNAKPACTFNFSMCADKTPAPGGGAGTGAMPGGMMRGSTGGSGR